MMGLPGPIFNPRNTSSVTSIWCFLVKYWCGNILMEILKDSVYICLLSLLKSDFERNRGYGDATFG